MPAESTSPSERITAAFSKLTESAKVINDASNELAQPIASLERSLHRLNIGVACWATISGGEEFDEYWSNDVGYARVKKEWCLAIRSRHGNHNFPDPAYEEVWPFNEAPRHLRAKAVDKLPDLLEAMVPATDATAGRLKEKVAPAKDLASAVSTLLGPKKK